MSSKAYVLKQIRDILEYRGDEDIDKFIEKHENDKVYELLVIKKNLRQKVSEEENEDVSISTTFLKK